MGESGKVRGVCAALLRKCTSSRTVFHRMTMKGTDRRRKLDALLEIFAAEIIGTALLMYFGCMGCFASASAAHSQPLPPMQSALVFGFLVSSLVTAMGHISKTHLNPAVTLCAYLLGTISAWTAAVYFVAETLGAILGSFLLTATTPAALFELYATNSTKGFCTTTLAPDLAIGQGFLIEFTATSFLVFMVCSVWDPRNAGTSDSVALKFALLVAALSICAGPFTGASLNPVRTLAPAILNNKWDDHWLYWLAPLSGSAVTTTLYKHLFMRSLTPNANTVSTSDELATRNLTVDSLKERKALNGNDENSSDEKSASDVP